MMTTQTIKPVSFHANPSKITFDVITRMNFWFAFNYFDPHVQKIVDNVTSFSTRNTLSLSSDFRWNLVAVECHQDVRIIDSDLSVRKSCPFWLGFTYDLETTSPIHILTFTVGNSPSRFFFISQWISAVLLHKEELRDRRFFNFTKIHYRSCKKREGYCKL